MNEIQVAEAQVSNSSAFPNLDTLQSLFHPIPDAVPDCMMEYFDDACQQATNNL